MSIDSLNCVTLLCSCFALGRVSRSNSAHTRLSQELPCNYQLVCGKNERTFISPSTLLSSVSFLVVNNTAVLNVTNPR